MLGLGLGLRLWGSGIGGTVGVSLAPAAPVLTWVTAASDNTPDFSAEFDDTHVHDAGDIDGSNYDEIEFRWDTDSNFGSPDEDSNTLDAGELTAGTASITTGTLADGTWYAQVRHNHVVAGVDHFSPWSNTVSETIATVSVVYGRLDAAVI